MKRYLCPHIHCNIIYNSQYMGITKVSISGWMDEDVKYIHAYTCIHTMEYYLAIKRNETLPHATVCMDQEDITLTKITQTEKDKYHMTLVICGI